MATTSNIPHWLKKTVQYLWFWRSKHPWLNFPIPCLLPFGSWYLAYGDGMGLWFFSKRPYEEHEWRFVAKYLKPGMTFFDIGANQGFYTLLAAKQVGLKGKVFSFEPVPTQVVKLKRNIRLNGFWNVTVEPQAVGSSLGLASMHVCLDGDEALSSLRPPASDIKSAKEVITVPMTTLDNYVKNQAITAIDVMKIDVEGGELPVLEGGVGIFTTLRPVVMCEVQDVRTQSWGYPAKKICEFLEGHGYSWFSIDSSGRLLPVLGQGKHERGGENLIAIPKEKLADIINH